MEQGGVDKAAPRWPLPAVELHEHVEVEVEEEVAHEEGQQVVGGVGCVIERKEEAEGEVSGAQDKQEDDPRKSLPEKIFKKIFTWPEKQEHGTDHHSRRRSRIL